ncbi:MAG: hypothetical protein KJ630_00700 [Proteobacteria bacterium]|nr:hypothetical protein [Pseudomonadota bacterium]
MTSRDLRFSNSFYCFLLVLLAFGQGCAFTPKPVFLTEKPTSVEQVAKKDIRLALVVKDTRPTSYKDYNMVGLMRNSFMIPTSFVFLAHKENLETILAYHVKGILENSGYQVVSTIPEVPAKLGADKLAKPPGDSEKSSSAMQNISNENRQDLKAAEVKQQGSTVAELDNSNSEEVYNYQEADAILEIKIDKYSSDVLQAMLFVSTQAWAKLKLAAIDPTAKTRKILFGKTVTGFGTSGPRQIITEDCFIVAVNMSHWIALNEVENIIRSDEFVTAVKRVKTTVKQ